MRSISICGFKSIFEKQRIELAEITILAGANSSGKSSALQPLLLMKQTIESQYDPGVLLLDGANVKFTSMDQVLSKRTGSEIVEEFSIEFEDEKGWALEATFKKRKEGGVAGGPATIRTEKGAELKYWNQWVGDLVELENTLPPPKHVMGIVDILTKDNNRRARWVGRSGRCFPDLEMEVASDDGRPPIPIPAQTEYTEKIRKNLASLIHIRGLRGNPERSYRATAKSKMGFPGAFEDYVASVLLEWQSENSNKLQDIGADLKCLGLSWKIAPKAIQDTQVEILVGRLNSPVQGGAHDLVSLADVGLGVSQILPLLVALRIAKKGQMVIVEQPEIHLHPRAQFELASIIIRAAKRGVQMLIETHSSVLLRALQIAIVRGEIKSEHVALNWFSRDSATGATHVSVARPDNLGGYGEWPVDFEEVSLSADQQYLDSVVANGLAE